MFNDMWGISNPTYLQCMQYVRLSSIQDTSFEQQLDFANVSKCW